LVTEKENNTKIDAGLPTLLPVVKYDAPTRDISGIALI
jgi:hypothetical protein